MKLNTKKGGGIELHADEKRVLDRAAEVAFAVGKLGTKDQSAAAAAVCEAIAKLRLELAKEPT